MKSIKTKKLSHINTKFTFKFKKDVDFSEQRLNMPYLGASQVASLFAGGNDFLDFLREDLGLEKKEFTVEQVKKMRRGKQMEDIILQDFYLENEENIKKLYKNKYRNGVDKYNYAKPFNSKISLVCATPDAWFIDNENNANLVEIKHTNNYELIKAANEYNTNGNFLSNKWFFKYFVQVQMQLACTDLKEAILYIDFQSKGIECKIKRNDQFLVKILSLV